MLFLNFLNSCKKLFSNLQHFFEDITESENSVQNRFCFMPESIKKILFLMLNNSAVIKIFKVSTILFPNCETQRLAPTQWHYVWTFFSPFGSYLDYFVCYDSYIIFILDHEVFIWAITISEKNTKLHISDCKSLTNFADFSKSLIYMKSKNSN